MKGFHWINLGPWPPALAVVNNKRSYDAFMRKHKIADAMPFPKARSGSCYHMTNGRGEGLFIISLGEFTDPIEQAATLAHEATHAMRWLLEYVGEKEPGTETQAYLVEHIVKHGLRALR